MPLFIDLSGKVFHRLTVISRDGVDYPTKYICICECGTKKSIMAVSLTTGRTKSCGCYQTDMRVIRGSKHLLVHGLKKHELYNTWHGMMARCYNPKATKYYLYGGRSVSVCERWHDVKNFIQDMSPRPEGLTLDRKDVNGNYEPSNCRWATHMEQRHNIRL